MRRLFFILICILFIINQTSNGQNDSLKIFTQQGCGNCKYAKEQFQLHSVNYIEYGVENKENVLLMFNCLHQIGYKGKITMPVMVLNNKVYHPVLLTKDTLENISLSSAIDSILLRIQVEGLHLAKMTRTIESKESIAKLNPSDCEAHLAPIYLVCQNFKSKSEAIILVQKLKDDGYTNAGIVDYQSFYRVYNKYFLNTEFANEALVKEQTRNGAAYLLTVN